jgi:hypothetical protein
MRWLLRKVAKVSMTVAQNRTGELLRPDTFPLRQLGMRNADHLQYLGDPE